VKRLGFPVAVVFLAQFLPEASAAWPRLDLPRPYQRELAAISMRHLQPWEGWQRTETANFRIYHNQPRELAEKVAWQAEVTRRDMSRRWLGSVPADWMPRCIITLHANVNDYCRDTGLPPGPGRSQFRSDNGRVTSRSIDLLCENTDRMLQSVLPHEATHIVLGEHFIDRQIPRWADEGMAILSEPRERIELHLDGLEQFRQDRLLFSVGQLMKQRDYPDRQQAGAFYAQSVSLVEFMAREKGPRTFTRFLQDAQKIGYEEALQKHYGYGGFAELQRRWSGQAFASGQ
jgi:hypothetical protein